MILLPINKDIVQKLFEHHITSDYIGSTLIVLYSLYHHNYTLLDELDKENNDIMFLRIYKDLEMKKIVQKTDPNTTVLFELTDLGLSLIADIENIMKQNKTEISKPKDILVPLDFIDQWLNLWKNEKGIFIRAGEYSLGASKKDIQVKMNSFIKNYKYIFTDMNENQILDVIFAVTKKHLNDERKNGYAYTRKCSNFISKVENHSKDSKVSDLAMKCEEYINQTTSTPKEFNFYDTSIN